MKERIENLECKDIFIVVSCCLVSLQHCDLHPR